MLLVEKSFSMHKHRPLTKFMSIILPDGYCLETIDPFYSIGANNDAGMTWAILNILQTIQSQSSNFASC